MWLKLIPNGFTQKWSSRSGSRAVMWPATPSSKPNFPNSRKPAARRCLRCWRSSSTVSYFGRYQRSSRAVSRCVSVIGTLLVRCGVHPRGVVTDGRRRGRPARRRRRRRCTRSPVAPASVTRRAPSSGPATKAALASTSARHASPATTVTDASPDSRGRAGARIDEVVQRRPRPASTPAAARVLVAIAPSAKASSPVRPVASGSSTLDHPAVRLRRVPARAQVAAEVHAARRAHPGSRRRAARSTTGSAAYPLPMPPRSSATPAGNRTADTTASSSTPVAARDRGRRLGHRRARASRRRRSRGRSPPLRGRRAPSGRSDRRSHRHASTARVDQREGVGRHHDRRAAGVVEPAQLAGGPEAGPPRFARLQGGGRQLAELGHRGGVGPDRQHLDVGAHRPKPRRWCEHASVHGETVREARCAGRGARDRPTPRPPVAWGRCASPPWTSGRTPSTSWSPTCTPTGTSTRWSRRRRCSASATS